MSHPPYDDSAAKFFDRPEEARKERARIDLQNTNDTLAALSVSVTKLAEAIDPSHSHGPETAKLVEHVREIRRLAMVLVRCCENANNGVSDKVRTMALELRLRLEN